MHNAQVTSDNEWKPLSSVVKKILLATVATMGLSGCEAARNLLSPPAQVAAIETEQALCESWRDSLPSRSNADTEQTQDEIENAYNVFLAACPGYELPF